VKEMGDSASMRLGTVPVSSKYLQSLAAIAILVMA
jgi:hypothetical protein